MDLMAKCGACGKPEFTSVDAELWEKYCAGALVQNVWPELNNDEREIIIGARNGFHTCGVCWDELFSDEEAEA